VIADYYQLPAELTAVVFALAGLGYFLRYRWRREIDHNGIYWLPAIAWLNWGVAAIYVWFSIATVPVELRAIIVRVSISLLALFHILRNKVVWELLGRKVVACLRSFHRFFMAWRRAWR
jgi:hypothetical protein